MGKTCQLPRIRDSSMKLILILLFLFLRGFSIKANETDSERFEKILNTFQIEFKGLQDEIKILKERIVNLEKENGGCKIDQIKQLEVKLNDNIEPIEERVETLEQLAKFKTLRSCQELSNRGLTKSGIYEVDPDGDGIGFGPITVQCNFETNET